MLDQLLPEDDHISRYCKPSAIAESGLPLASAFGLRQGEEYLSVNWLEYFRLPELSAAVEKVREAFRSKGYQVRPNGRFVVLNIGAAKRMVFEGVRCVLRINHHPLANDPSHASILGYGPDDLMVAVELAALATPQDVYKP